MLDFPVLDMAFFQECRLEFKTRILSFKTLVLFDTAVTHTFKVCVFSCIHPFPSGMVYGEFHQPEKHEDGH